MNDVIEEKGEMFTFALGKHYDGQSSACVLIIKGKHKLSPKKNPKGDWMFSHYIKGKDYATMLRKDSFEKLFDKKLKAGEVRHGRLKLRLLKRKKK